MQQAILFHRATSYVEISCAGLLIQAKDDIEDTTIFQLDNTSNEMTSTVSLDPIFIVFSGKKNSTNWAWQRWNSIFHIKGHKSAYSLTLASKIYSENCPAEN